MKPNQHFAKALKGTLLFMMMCFATYSHAQNKCIKLMLKDKNTQAPLYYASATLINLQDSMIMATQVTQPDGLISFNVTQDGKYKILVEKDGYDSETYYSSVSNQAYDANGYFTLSLGKRKGKTR